MRSALEHPEGSPLSVAIPTPAFIVIVLSAPEAADAEVVLIELTAALRRSHPTPRLLALLPPGGEGAPAIERARALRSRVPVAAVAHDPARSAWFDAGSSRDGLRFEMNDELREAEAVVLAVERRAGRPEPAAAALYPGLASRAARAAFDGLEAPARRERARAEALECVRVDYALIWRRAPSGELVASAGSVPSLWLDPPTHRR